MSAVYLGVGQCGNQVLASFLTHCLELDPRASSVLDVHKKCRAVFVDSEPKVVQHLASSAALRGRVRSENLIHGTRGRGSNWSYGYHGCSSEDHLVSRALDSCRREVERNDSIGGFVLCHSLAGGTGSGLGTRLSEQLRERFGIRLLLNCTVSPYRHGESPMQTYNAALCLAHLLESSDGVLLFSNDHLLRVASSGQAAQVPVANQDTINRQLARQLANLLMPCRSLYIHSRYMKANQEVWDLSRCLWPFPEAKLAQCVSAARLSRSTAPVDWLELTKALCSQGRAAAAAWAESEDLLKNTLTALCVARGDAGNSFAARTEEADARLRQVFRPVRWNSQGFAEFWTDPSGSPPSLTLAFNSAQFGSQTLGGMAHRCRLKAGSGAYLHWFERHGTTRDAILSACDRLDRSATFYDWLSRSDASDPTS